MPRLRLMASAPSAADDPRRERLLTALGIAISLVSLAAVVWWASDQPAPKLPDTGGELAALAGSIAIYAAATALRGERAFQLLAHSGAEPARADAYGLTVVGYMGNNVLPARAGDLMRVYLQAPRARTSMRNVIGTLVAERALDVATLLSLFALLAYVILDGIDAPGGERLVIIAGVLALIAAVVGTVVYLARHHPRVRAALGFIVPMATATRNLRGPHGLRMLGLTLGIWALEAATYFAVAQATGLAMSALEALYLVALASVFVLIPAGPGYAGTLDAAVIFGVRAIGGTGSEAVAYLITLRFVLLVPITIAGLVLVLTRYGGWARVRAGASEAEAT
jgi:glycosyltransferase 2 family protein